MVPRLAGGDGRVEEHRNEHGSRLSGRHAAPGPHPGGAEDPLGVAQDGLAPDARPAPLLVPDALLREAQAEAQRMAAEAEAEAQRLR